MTDHTKKNQLDGLKISSQKRKFVFQKEFAQLFVSVETNLVKSREWRILQQFESKIRRMPNGNKHIELFDKFKWRAPSTHKNGGSFIFARACAYASLVLLYKDVFSGDIGTGLFSLSEGDPVLALNPDDFVEKLQGVIEDDAISFLPILALWQLSYALITCDYPVRWVDKNMQQKLDCTQPLSAVSLDHYAFPDISCFCFPENKGVGQFFLLKDEDGVSVIGGEPSVGMLVFPIKNNEVQFGDVSKYETQHVNQPMTENWEKASIPLISANLITYICCSQYTEKEIEIKTAGSGFAKKKGKDSFKTPVFLGQEPVSVGRTKYVSDLISRKSVASHWRKGHFAKQRYGKGNAKTKIIWRQPMLINPCQD